MFEYLFDVIFSAISTLWVNYKVTKYGKVNIYMPKHKKVIVIYKEGGVYAFDDDTE